MTALKNRERILDVREERTGATPFEFREDVATGYVMLRGYAATYEPYDCYGGPDAGGWVEQLNRNSFKRTLEAQPDVMLLLNHTGAPLARTKSGTMTLSADRRGLLVEARLDPSDPDVQALLPKMRRGDLDEMSFAFRVKDQEWDTNYTHRTITEVSLQKGDVSVVNYGMNPNTRVGLSESTVGALASLSQGQLAELRRLDTDIIERAISNLTRVAKSAEDKEECEMDPMVKDSKKRGGYPFDEEEEEEKGVGCDCECGQDPCVCDSERAEDDECECDEEPCVCDKVTDPKPMRVDATLASAIDVTLISAYGLCDDAPEAQLKIKQARRQLDELRGIKDAPTAVDIELANLRKECGLPDTARLDEAFQYLRSNAADPGHWQTHLAVKDDSDAADEI
jgi:HK97 family phage prohead protease